MSQAIAEQVAIVENFAESDCMKNLLALLITSILLSTQVSAGGLINRIANANANFEQADRQRAADENKRLLYEQNARDAQRDKWKFENEKKRHDTEQKNTNQKTADAGNEIQTLIDQNLTLKTWQSNSPEKWKMAIRFDNFLMGLDEYKLVPAEARFKDVAETMEAYFLTKGEYQ